MLFFWGIENLHKHIQDFFDRSCEKSPFAQVVNELEQAKLAKQPVTLSFTCGALIELLGQFYEGSLSKTGSAKRFLRFAQDYVKLSKANASVIYQYRNAVVHGFGNHAFNKTMNKEFRFYRDVEQTTLVVKRGGSTYGINPQLYANYVLEAAAKYQRDLEKDALLQEKFDRVYRRVGQLL